MTPLDAKTEEEWGRIVENAAQRMGMTCCLADANGEVFFCRHDRFPLCARIRDEDDSRKFICAQTDAAMRAAVEKTKRPEVDMCEAGLLRVVVPIVRNDTFIGEVIACGLASKDEEFDSFLVAKQLNIDEEHVEELAKSTPFGSEEELSKIADELFEEVNS